MEKPTVSVVLCVYNPDIEQFYQAVKSIIEQSFTKWEMILYDDGSDTIYKDDIYKISGMDYRIRYVRNEQHHSLAYGLNEAMKLARGKYIARMDGDDISYPERLEKQVCFLEENEVYMWVGSNIATIDEEGNKWGERFYPVLPEKKDFLKFSPYAHPSVMIRIKELLSYGGYKTGEHPYRSEDYELFMRLHALGEQGVNLQEVLLKYRETKESYGKRTLAFQLQEAGVRLEGFERLGLRNPLVWFYILKPVFVWMIPDKWLYAMKRRR